MNYSELRDFCKKHQITIQSVADDVKISIDGLKRGIDKKSLAMRYIVPLCESLCITPNQFFGIDGDYHISQIQNGGVGNTQSVADSDTLREQLRVKDEQINKLLNLLSK